MSNFMTPQNGGTLPAPPNQISPGADKAVSYVAAAVGLIGAMGGLALTGAIIFLTGSASYYLIKKAKKGR